MQGPLGTFILQNATFIQASTTLVACPGATQWPIGGRCAVCGQYLTNSSLLHYVEVRPARQSAKSAEGGK